MVKYFCDRCGALVKTGQIVNDGTALKPEWICKDCKEKKTLHGAPLGASMKKAGDVDGP